MLLGLYTYVVNVCSRCFICFFRCMLQMCLSRCCICFIHILQVFYLDAAYVCNGFQVLQVFFQVFSDSCFKCFICLQIYVASVAPRCFKSRSGVAHVTTWPDCCSYWRGREGCSVGSGGTWSVAWEQGADVGVRKSGRKHRRIQHSFLEDLGLEE
jgi:hypothetical protein